MASPMRTISLPQGFERMDGELLDAAVGQLVPAGSMFAFLAAHRAEVSRMRSTRTCSPCRGWAGRRCRLPGWPWC